MEPLKIADLPELRSASLATMKSMSHLDGVTFAVMAGDPFSNGDAITEWYSTWPRKMYASPERATLRRT
jgi:hypothetical protein